MVDRIRFGFNSNVRHINHILLTMRITQRYRPKTHITYIAHLHSFTLLLEQFGFKVVNVTSKDKQKLYLQKKAHSANKSVEASDEEEKDTPQAKNVLP